MKNISTTLTIAICALVLTAGCTLQNHKEIRSRTSISQRVMSHAAERCAGSGGLLFVSDESSLNLSFGGGGCDTACVRKGGRIQHEYKAVCVNGDEVNSSFIENPEDRVKLKPELLSK